MEFLKSCASDFRRLCVVHDASFAEACNATCNGDQFLGLRFKCVGSEACVMKLLECSSSFWGHWGFLLKEVKKREIRRTFLSNWLRAAENDRGWDHCLRNFSRIGLADGSHNDFAWRSNLIAWQFVLHDPCLTRCHAEVPLVNKEHLG